MILGRDDFLGLQYFEYCPQEMAPKEESALLGKAWLNLGHDEAFNVIPCLALMFKNRELAFSSFALLLQDANSFKTQKGKITISFTSEADGDYEFQCLTSLGPGVCGGIQPELVQRFLEILAIAPFYIVTCGYFPNTGEVGGRAGDEYILAKEGIMILKNKVTVDGKDYFSFDTPENVASYAEDFRKFVTKETA